MIRTLVWASYYCSCRSSLSRGVRRQAGREPRAMTPEAEPLSWMLPDYRKRIDFERTRLEVSFTRRPVFPAVFDNARQVQRLDGDVA